MHPTFLRTVPPYFHQADVWLELLKHFQWKRVIFIHSMDEEGRMILSRFQALAEKEDIEVKLYLLEYRVQPCYPEIRKFEIMIILFIVQLNSPSSHPY